MACPCVDKLQSFCLRLKGYCSRRSRIGHLDRRSLKISEPFDFKHVSDTPIGFDSDEMNAFCEKAAARRMIAMEDQQLSPSRRPSTAAGGPTQAVPVITYYSHGHSHGRLPAGAMSSSTGSTANNNSNSPGSGRPQQVKSRAGYRGLASSSAAMGGASRKGSLAYASPTTESRPSLTHSFAATVDSSTQLAPMSSYATSSSTSISGREGRSFSSTI